MARRGAAAEEQTPQHEMEDLLSKVLTTEFDGGSEDDEDDEPTVDDEGPLSSDREEAAGDESETDDEAEASEEDGEPAAKSDPDDEDEEDHEPLAAEAKKPADDGGRKSLEEQIEGLKRELVKQRQKNRDLQQAPPPAQTTAQPASQQIPQAQPNDPNQPMLAVMVSEDGKSVYVDPTSLAKRDQYIIDQAVARSRQMSPEDQKIRAAGQAVDRFISEDETNRDIVQRAKAVDDFVTLNLQQMIANGRRFSSVEEAIETLRLEGIDQQVAEYFPETEGVFDEFVAGMASDNPLYRVGAMKLLKRKGRQADPGEPVPVELGRLKSVKDGPKSMSRKGGTRSQSPSADKAEFDSLQAAFRRDFLAFSDKDMNRMKALGRKLEVPGYEVSE